MDVAAPAPDPVSLCPVISKGGGTFWVVGPGKIISRQSPHESTRNPGLAWLHRYLTNPGRCPEKQHLLDSSPSGANED